jgi:hypothetical protein
MRDGPFAGLAWHMCSATGANSVLVCSQLCMHVPLLCISGIIDAIHVVSSSDCVVGIVRQNSCASCHGCVSNAVTWCWGSGSVPARVFVLQPNHLVLLAQGKPLGKAYNTSQL